MLSQGGTSKGIAGRPGRIAAVIGSGLGAAAVGALLGLIIGANLGGNSLTTLSYGGLNGYELTGAMGSIAGGIVGGFLGVVLALWRYRGQRRG